MANIWKKWVAATGGMRSILAFLYILANLGISLDHTCQSGKNVYHCHSERTNHQLEDDCYVAVQYITTFNQNSLSDKTETHNLYCPACLYSLTSKTFRLCSNVSLCSTQTVTRTQVLPQLSFIKQLEWFCSAPLRAPPSITS